MAADAGWISAAGGARSGESPVSHARTRAFALDPWRRVPVCQSQMQLHKRRSKSCACYHVTGRSLLMVASWRSLEWAALWCDRIGPRRRRTHKVGPRCLSRRPPLGQPRTPPLPTHKSQPNQTMSRPADPRFAKLTTDPRFQRPKASKNKIVVDDRFKQFFDQRKLLAPACLRASAPRQSSASESSPGTTLRLADILYPMGVSFLVQLRRPRPRARRAFGWTSTAVRSRPMRMPTT